MVDLEQTPEQEEVTAQVSEEESKQKVSNEKGEVSGTEEAKPSEDVEKIISERLEEAKKDWERDWQSRKDKELKPLYDRIANFEKEKDDALLRATEQREIDELGDTREVRDWQAQRRELTDRERRAAQKEEEQNKKDEEFAKREQDIDEHEKIIKAYQLAAEDDIDVNELLKAKTPDEMENIALRLTNKKLREQGLKPPQVVDSGVTSSADDSDEAFLKRWNAGDEENSKENQARVNKILSKLR